MVTMTGHRGAIPRCRAICRRLHVLIMILLAVRWTVAYTCSYHHLPITL